MKRMSQCLISSSCFRCNIWSLSIKLNRLNSVTSAVWMWCFPFDFHDIFIYIFITTFSAEVKLVWSSPDHVTNQTVRLKSPFALSGWSDCDPLRIEQLCLQRPCSNPKSFIWHLHQACEKHLHLHLLVEWCCQTQSELVEKLYWMLQQIERSHSALTRQLSFSIEL